MAIRREYTGAVRCSQAEWCAFLVGHWSCAYSIRNFVRISYTHLLIWDTTLPYYNRMILSTNVKSFIRTSHKKSLTKIIMAPHTKFGRDFFRCIKTEFLLETFPSISWKQLNPGRTLAIVGGPLSINVWMITLHYSGPLLKYSTDLSVLNECWSLTHAVTMYWNKLYH